MNDTPIINYELFSGNSRINDVNFAIKGFLVTKQINESQAGTPERIGQVNDLLI